MRCATRTSSGRASPCSTTRRRSTPSSTSAGGVGGVQDSPAGRRVHRLGLHAAAEPDQAGQVPAELPARDRPRRRYSAARTAAPCLRSARRSTRRGHARTSATTSRAALPPALRRRSGSPGGRRTRTRRRSPRGVVPLGGRVRLRRAPAACRQRAPLVHFVTTSRRGYCQHFAGRDGADAPLPRNSRAGGGRLSSGVYDEERKQWTVYDRDAHTWVEVWFNGYGWLPFDPTPGRGTLAGPYTTSSTRFDATGAAGVSRPARSWAAPEAGGCFGSSGKSRPEALTPNTTRARRLRADPQQQDEGAGRARRCSSCWERSARSPLRARQARPAAKPLLDTRSAPDRRRLPAGARRVPA